MTSGSHIELDLIEFVQVTNYVHAKVGFQERASCIIPVTVGRGYKNKYQNNSSSSNKYTHTET